MVHRDFPYAGVNILTYESRIDELIGRHVADYQAELALAKQLNDCLDNLPMPYGYPQAVYNPCHSYRLAVIDHLVKHSGGALSNRVPWVLGMEIVKDYPLGIYNPRPH